MGILYITMSEILNYYSSNITKWLIEIILIPLTVIKNHIHVIKRDLVSVKRDLVSEIILIPLTVIKNHIHVIMIHTNINA